MGLHAGAGTVVCKSKNPNPGRKRMLDLLMLAMVLVQTALQVRSHFRKKPKG
jgi:uncharacterized protein YaaN involved in tellurite resistance